LYHEKVEKEHCPKCKETLTSCKCEDMCVHCKFYLENSCKNEKSGNFKLILKYDEICSKFTKKVPAKVDYTYGRWF